MGANCGMNAETIDAKGVYHAANIIAEAAESLNKSEGAKDAVVLLRALAILTAEDAFDGNPAPRFSAERLRKACAEVVGCSTYWVDNDDSARKKFRDAWRTLEARFKGFDDNLKCRAEKAGVAVRLGLFCEEDPNDRRAKRYGFNTLEPWFEATDNGITATALPPVKARVAAGEIEYLAEVEIPLPLIRRHLEVNVSGWRSLVLTLPVVVAAAVGAAIGWLLLMIWVSELPIRKIFEMTLLLGLFGLLLIWLARPAVNLISYKIVRAPGIFQLADPLPLVLVLRPEGERAVVRLMRYTSQCPLCGGVIEVGEGSRELRGRYVGACRLNPIEHVIRSTMSCCAAGACVAEGQANRLLGVSVPRRFRSTVDAPWRLAPEAGSIPPLRCLHG